MADRNKFRIFHMKFTKFIHLFTTALLIAMLVLSLPVMSARAATKGLEPRPTTGKIGDDIDVFGFGFTATFTIYLYFSDEEADTGDQIDDEVDDYKYLGSTTVYSDGEIDTSIEIPEKLSNGAHPTEKVKSGTYYIYATYSTMSQILAVVSFTVEATGAITIDNTSGPVGTEVTITGQDYGDEEDIAVKYDGTSLSIESGDTDTDNDGEFVCKVVIPESASGNHTISVSGADSNAEATASFAIEPVMTSAPSSGVTGTSITVSGTGFKASTDTTITFGDDAATVAATDLKGNFSTSFAAPKKSTGSYTIEANDGTNSKETSFDITTTSLILNPVSGEKDSTVTVTGSGFLPDKAITISFKIAESNAPTVATPTSDSSGGFTTSFEVPVSEVNVYKVIASDGTNSNEADFSVVLDVSGDISPDTSVNSPGYIGTELTVSGSGFIAGETVTIEYDGDKVTTATVGPEPDRSFSAKFEVPESGPGEHTVTASDGTNTERFIFFMETDKPNPPRPLKPEMGIKATAEAFFDWEDVTDPSGIIYTLEIATSDDFSEDSIVLTKTEIKKSEYTIPREDRLKSVSQEAPYYWRVKATDGVGNEGRWSGTGEFYIGTSFSIPQPLVYTLIIVGVLALAIFAFWMGRKTAYY